ncbi:class I tRNA ligase family protein, partial [archaeon]|nr:class I tRNA ligase family protein [archaeon]
HWPKRISFHGMITSGGEKMSKSKGNQVTLLEVNNKFGPDAFRAFMCNSTSVESAFNWESSLVYQMKKHLFDLFETIKAIQANKKESDAFKKYPAFVSRTERALIDATKAIEKMDLRNYSRIVLHDLLHNYKKARNSVEEADLPSINAFIGGKWVKLLCPLVPHLAEELWSIGGSQGFVSLAEWPQADESLIDLKLEKIEDVISGLRLDILKTKGLAKLENISRVKVFVAPEWKWKAIEIVKKACREKPDFNTAMKALMADNEMKKHAGEVPALAKTILYRLGELMELELFDEFSAVNEAKKTLEKELDCKVEAIKAEESTEPKAKNSFPGKPAILIE